MEISLFLAKVLGLYCVIAGVFLFVKPDFWRSVIADFQRIPALVALSGSLSLILGLLIVVSHNFWEWSWVVVITILGWITLIRGLLALFLPEKIQAFANSIKESHTLNYFGIVSIVVGIFLLYHGYFA